MKKINVCHIVSGLNSGGAETVIYNYCSKMSSEKYNFHILYQHQPSEKDLTLFGNLGFKLLRIPSKAKHPLKNYLCTYNYLRENSIDVVHCHMTLMNFIPLIAAKKQGIEVRICHAHSCGKKNNNKIIKIVESILKRICIKYSTDLIACGREAGNIMYGDTPHFILNNAIDIDKYKFDLNKRKKIRNFYDIDDEKIVLGHIGRFIEVKNHMFLIDLISLMQNHNPNFILMLVGDGELKEKIEQEVIDRKLGNKVIFTGIVSNTDEFYSAFDYFLLPSLYEGLPLVGLEAQISGLTSIFSDNIDKEVLLNSKSCMINLDLEKWRDLLLEDVTNPVSRDIDYKIVNSKKLNIDNECFKLDAIYSERFKKCEKQD